MEVYELLKKYDEKYRLFNFTNCNDVKQDIYNIYKYLTHRNYGNFFHNYIGNKYDLIFNVEQKQLIDKVIIDISHNVTGKEITDLCWKLMFGDNDKDIVNKSLFTYCYIQYVNSKYKSKHLRYYGLTNLLYKKDGKLIEFEKMLLEDYETNETMNSSLKTLMDANVFIHDDFFVVLVQNSWVCQDVLDLYKQYKYKYNIEMFKNLLSIVADNRDIINNKVKIIKTMIDELQHIMNPNILISVILNCQACNRVETDMYLEFITQPYIIKCADFINFIMKNRRVCLVSGLNYISMEKMLSLIDKKDLNDNEKEIFPIICINKILFDKYAKQIDNINSLIDQNMLYKICEFGTDSNVLDILLSYKLTPDMKCFELLCQSSYKDEFNNIVKVLVNYGFHINVNVVDCALKYDKIIDDLEVYDIKYDIELFKLCITHSYIPCEYLTKMDQNYIKLIILFKEAPREIIDMYIKENDQIADNYCFETAMKHNYNEGIIDYVISLGYKPDISEIICIDNKQRREYLYNYFYGKKKPIIAIS